MVQNLIKQVGSLTSSIQSMVGSGFLLVVVVLQTIPTLDRRT